MIRFIEFGDIFQIEGVENYAHGCNCSGVMGKGIAVQFKAKFPNMFKQYNILCKKGEFTLGDVFEYNYGDGYIFNLGTQLSWRNRAEISAIKQSFEKMLSLASKKGVNKIALPKIGAGLGGLNWLDVKKVIEDIAETYPKIDIYIVENYKEGVKI